MDKAAAEKWIYWKRMGGGIDTSCPFEYNRIPFLSVVMLVARVGEAQHELGISVAFRQGCWTPEILAIFVKCL